MRMGPTFLVLLCFLICVSNGAPPRRAGKMSNFGVPYTEEEDQLIVDELSNILGGTIKPQNRAVWHKIAEKHSEKWNQGTSGFSEKRSAEGLRKHFLVLAKKKAHSTVEIPEALIQKYKEGVAGSSSRQPTTSNQEGGLQGQVTNEEQRDSDWIADMIEELQNTEYQVDFSKLE